MGWQGKHKKRHVSGEPLEVTLLRAGEIDVCLETGRVYSLLRGKRRLLSIQQDRDGYQMVHLAREKKHKRGTPYIDKDPQKGTRNRWRHRRCALVHRLVKIKSIACAMGGERWREHVRDLPPNVDVNHLHGKADNRDTSLELSTDRANRSRTQLTQAEIDAQHEAFMNS